MTTIDVTRSAQLAEVAAEAATAVGDMPAGRSGPDPRSTTSAIGTTP